MNPNRQWLICLQDEVIGPFPETTLLILIRNQRLSGTDYVWRDGLSHWTRLIETPEFTSHFAKIPRTLPPFKSHASSAAPKTETRPEFRATGKPDSGNINRPHRVPLEGWVRFEGGELHKVLNISESGVLVAIPENVPLIGKEVRFRLESPAFGRPLEMTGVLVREDFSTNENAVAVEFSRLNPAYRRMIKEYVQSREFKKTG